MGLNNESNAVFLSIADGKITKRVKEPTERSQTRTTKEGKTVHEEHYKSISGLITDIKVYSHEQYGKFWNITVEDDGISYILQTNYSGGYASTFLKALPNVNFSRPVTLNPYVKVVNDKKKVSLYVNQDGAAVPWYFTKDEPHGLPPMVQVKVKGQLTWDDSDMMEFLEKYVEEKIKPSLKKGVFMHPEPSTVEDNPRDKKAQPKSVSEEDILDDLPF